MQICDLNIGSFRIFKEKSIFFSPGVNLIKGENGVGKTTLLEALYVLMAGKSFRAPQLSDLIKEGDSFFRVEAHFEKWGIPQVLKMSLQDKERKIQYNHTSLGTLSGLLGILHGVLIAPHDMELIKGAPAVRRHYLDFQIAQVDPLYIHHLTRYSRALKQRNAQLRSRKIKAIEIFEEALAQSGAYVVSKRETASHELCLLLKHYYHKISGKNEDISLQYHSSYGKPIYEAILEKLAINRRREMDVGYTLSGPHRDDLFLLISGRPARHFASEGEMRSLASSLKLAEWERMREITEEPPILLVDDLGMSLDPFRLKSLFEIFSNLGQVLITSASENTTFIDNNNCCIINL